MKDPSAERKGEISAVSFIKRAYRRARRGVQYTHQVWQGAIDRRRLLRDFPALCDDADDCRRLRAALADVHARYVTQVSKPGMAISVELAAYLTLLCERLHPQSILDLGSGFSSYTLRRYAQSQPSVSVVSVDDDDRWLGRTEKFLQEHSLPTDRLLTWREFAAGDGHSFDLILHDLGTMDTRLGVLPAVLQRLSAEGGTIILDDMHKFDYASRAKSVVAAANLTQYSLRRFTLDRLGRFSTLAAPAPDRRRLSD